MLKMPEKIDLVRGNIVTLVDGTKFIAADTNDIFPLLCGGAIATELTLNGETTPQPAVVGWAKIDQYFTVELVKAMLYHEVGHLVCGHMRQWEEKGIEGVSTEISYEIEADAYAVSILGKEAIVEFLKIIPNVLNGIPEYISAIGVENLPMALMANRKSSEIRLEALSRKYH